MICSGVCRRGQQVFLRPEESPAPALSARQSTTLSDQLQVGSSPRLLFVFSDQVCNKCSTNRSAATHAQYNPPFIAFPKIKLALQAFFSLSHTRLSSSSPFFVPFRRNIANSELLSAGGKFELLLLLPSVG